MRISYSSLETYKSCPKKFKYQELDKIKVPKSIEAAFGTAVHSALKKMFERTPLYPTLDEISGFFIDAWKEKLLKINPEKVSESAQKAYTEEGLVLLKNFYKKNPPWNFNAVELESRFETVLEDSKTGERHTLSGIIDRIDKSPESDAYEIIDYKTSKKMPSQESLDKNLQLSIYGLGLLQKWPRLKPENIKLSLYFLPHNEKTETRRTTEQLAKTKTAILETINEIQELIKDNKEFIPLPSGLCGWCGYKKMCPMWRHLYKEQSEKQKTKSEIEQAIDEYFELKDETLKNNRKLKAIQADVIKFMNQEKVERVFGGPGYLTRLIQERTSVDSAKAKKILEEINRLEEVIIKKTFTTLKASKKKISKPDTTSL
ncbi:MAG: PD-(D/E)XK nuclease family protein [Candidatus Pacebacteria bacterium]|nr:PD-(D/E)XK nuclease family protein [Candidatus Paceibacterota bacterium]